MISCSRLAMSDPIIMCTLAPDAFQARRESIADLRHRAVSAEEIPGGVRVRFPAAGETLLAPASSTPNGSAAVSCGLRSRSRPTAAPSTST
jgi:hypothetical protein